MIVKDSLIHSYAAQFVEKCQNAGVNLNSKEIRAIDFLTKKLIEFNLWDKCVAIYPFVGRSAATHSFNLKNFLRHTIKWLNESSLLHDWRGVTNNGDGYGNTFVAPGIMSDNNIHVSVYNATFYPFLNQYSPIIGSSTPGKYQSAWLHTIFLKYPSQNDVWTYSCGPAKFGTSYSTSFSLAGEDAGDFLHARVYGLVVGVNGSICYLNGEQFGTANPPSRPNRSIPLNIHSSDPIEGIRYDWTQYPFMLFTHRAFGDPSVGYANANIRFASIGYGLNSKENKIFYDIVEQFQTILGRNVGNLKIDPDDFLIPEHEIVPTLQVSSIYQRPLLSAENILHEVSSELEISKIKVTGPRRVYVSDNINFGVSVQSFQELS
jgi:hypothetical protein